MKIKEELAKYNEMESITITLDYNDMLFTQKTEYLDNTTQVAVSKVLNTLSTLYDSHPNKEIVCKDYFNNVIETLLDDSVDIDGYSKLISSEVAMQVCAEAYFGSIFDTLYLDADIQNINLTGTFSVSNLTVSFNDSIVEIVLGLDVLGYDMAEIADIIGCSSELVNNIIRK